MLFYLVNILYIQKMELLQVERKKCTSEIDGSFWRGTVLSSNFCLSLVCFWLYSDSSTFRKDIIKKKKIFFMNWSWAYEVKDCCQILVEIGVLLSWCSILSGFYSGWKQIGLNIRTRKQWDSRKLFLNDSMPPLNDSISFGLSNTTRFCLWLQIPV